MGRGKRTGCLWLCSLGRRFGSLRLVSDTLSWPRVYFGLGSSVLGWLFRASLECLRRGYLGPKDVRLDFAIDWFFWGRTCGDFGAWPQDGRDDCGHVDRANSVWVSLSRPYWAGSGRLSPCRRYQGGEPPGSFGADTAREIEGRWGISDCGYMESALAVVGFVLWTVRAACQVNAGCDGAQRSGRFEKKPGSLNRKASSTL